MRRHLRRCVQMRVPPPFFCSSRKWGTVAIARVNAKWCDAQAGTGMKDVRGLYVLGRASARALGSQRANFLFRPKSHRSRKFQRAHMCRAIPQVMNAIAVSHFGSSCEKRWTPRACK